MKKRTFVIILIWGIFIAPKSFSQNDNLEPVQGIFDEYDFMFDYYSDVRKILMDGMSDIPDIRFLIIPSFTVEEVIAIEKENENYYLVHHKCEKSIWYNEENREKTKIIKRKFQISKTSVDPLKRLFIIAINERKYPDNFNFGADGINYYFSVLDLRVKTGKTWSPQKSTKMDKLVQIGRLLITTSNEAKPETIINLTLDELNKIEQLILEFEYPLIMEKK